MRAEWDSLFETGIPHIDAQHQALFDLFNELYRAIEGEYAEEVLVSTVKKLAAYTKFHFEAELNYMQIKKAPDLAAHKIEHDTCTFKVRLFVNKIVDGDIFFAKEVATFMHEWLTHHIAVYDVKLRDL